MKAVSPVAANGLPAQFFGEFVRCFGQFGERAQSPQQVLGDEGCAVHADHAQHTLLDENELDGRPLPIELSKNYSSVLEVLHRMHDPREHLYVLVVLEDTNIGDLLTADQRDIAVVVTLGRMTEKALDGPVDQDPQHVARTRGSVRRRRGERRRRLAPTGAGTQERRVRNAPHFAEYAQHLCHQFLGTSAVDVDVEGHGPIALGFVLAQIGSVEPHVEQR